MPSAPQLGRAAGLPQRRGSPRPRAESGLQQLAEAQPLAARLRGWSRAHVKEYAEVTRSGRTQPHAPPESLRALRAECPTARWGENAPSSSRSHEPPPPPPPPAATAVSGGLALPLYYLAATSRAPPQVPPPVSTPRRRRVASASANVSLRGAGSATAGSARQPLPRRGMDGCALHRNLSPLPGTGWHGRPAWRTGVTPRDPTSRVALTGVFSQPEADVPVERQRSRSAGAVARGHAPARVGEDGAATADDGSQGASRSPCPRSSRGASPRPRARVFSHYDSEAAKRLVPGFGATDRKCRPLPHEADNTAYADPPQGMSSMHSPMFRAQTAPSFDQPQKPQPSPRAKDTMGAYSTSPRHRRRDSPSPRARAGMGRAAQGAGARPAQAPAGPLSADYPLHSAVHAGFPSVVASLLAAGEDCTLKRDGRTPQQLAAEKMQEAAINGHPNFGGWEEVHRVLREWQEHTGDSLTRGEAVMGADALRNGLLNVLPRAAWEAIAAALPTPTVRRFCTTCRGARFIGEAELRQRREARAEGSPARPGSPRLHGEDAGELGRAWKNLLRAWEQLGAVPQASLRAVRRGERSGGSDLAVVQMLVVMVSSPPQLFPADEVGPVAKYLLHELRTVLDRMQALLEGTDGLTDSQARWLHSLLDAHRATICTRQAAAEAAPAMDAILTYAICLLRMHEARGRAQGLPPLQAPPGFAWPTDRKIVQL